jgi:hypothetical protein
MYSRKRKIDIKVSIDKQNSKKLNHDNQHQQEVKEKLDSLFDKFLLTDTNSGTDNDLFRMILVLAYKKW